MQLRTRLSDLITFRLPQHGSSETARQRDADSPVCEVSERCCNVMVSALVIGKPKFGSKKLHIWAENTVKNSARTSRKTKSHEEYYILGCAAVCSDKTSEGSIASICRAEYMLNKVQESS
jgi:hypothetical protein